MNVELANAALGDAKANPERFSMNSWTSGLHGYLKKTPETVLPCGTTACYAGFVALRVAPVGASIRDTYVCIPGQKSVHVEQYAANALEITSEQAGSLFYLGSIGEVEKAVNYLADNPGVEGDTLWDMFGTD